MDHLIREIVKKHLKEYQDKYQVTGNLISNLNIRPQKEILSDIRAIEGVTIVSEKELLPYNEQDKANFKVFLTVKMDGHVFAKTGGFNREKVPSIIEKIRKIEGVVNFITSPERIEAI